MTHWPANVLVPYARFLECQDRRRRFAAGVTPVDRPPAEEGDSVPGPALSETAAPPPLLCPGIPIEADLIDQLFNSETRLARTGGQE